MVTGDAVDIHECADGVRLMHSPEECPTKATEKQNVVPDGQNMGPPVVSGRQRRNTA